MKPKRVYIDTSVVGGCLEPKFRAASVALFERFRAGRMIMVVSNLLVRELQAAPSAVQEIMQDPAPNVERVLVTGASARLAARYIEQRVIGAARRLDAVHVATATVYRVDLLVSWDFKDIVNPFRVRGYNAVNAREGYPPLVIKSPEEVFRHGG